MKKLIFTLLALVGTMSMNAQIVKLYQGDVLVAKYDASKVDKVVFEEAPSFPFGQGEAAATGIGNVKWIQLWEGGPKFAEYNVGATSATGYGGYYTWGGTYNNNPELTGFVWTDDHDTGSSELSGDSDTATKLWGSNWRMPTQAELKALLDSCDVEWTTVNGVNGRKFTGKGDYSSNSVFLPAAGSCNGGNVSNVSGQGNYWSSTPNGDSKTYRLVFNSSNQYMIILARNLGCSVRPVLVE